MTSRLFSALESGDGFFPSLIRFLLMLSGLIGFAFFATVQLTWPQQAVMGLVLLILGMWLARSSDSYLITLTLMMMSMFSTVRYAWWRIGTVIGFFHDPGNKWGPLDALFIWVLVAAEAYAFVILFFGYMQTIWPLRRAPVPMPEDPEDWPDVDLVIPTYNEPLSVVRYTALAAMNIDWPSDRLHVYILDDGKREEFRRFAEEAGIGYMTRDDNAHAKAGNINRALKKLHSPYVAIFDCDHVPTRSFLQVTMGWFQRDKNLAMLQTPHHFYSPDPFERNLHQFRTIPNEGELFYGIVQDGNDFWNATFFCGSCAVLRRTALDEIGGIAVETVTEDAHTSLRMQMNGWNTAYINIPQAAGLATERLSGHVKQRIRWARGMIQILRTDNPLFAKGLKLPQRLCYFNAMTHFMYAMPRLIFLTAPLIYLLLSHTNVPGYWAAIFAYALPHLTLSNITNSRIQGQHRHSFWNEIYETVLSPYILLPTLLAMVNPKLGKFNVTDKGGTVNRTYFDSRIAQPFIVMLVFNFIGLLSVLPRFVHIPGFNWLWDGTHPGTIVMNALWTVFNIIILGTATAVARESQQRREQVRIAVQVPAKIKLAEGTLISGETIDVSSGGAALTMSESVPLKMGDTTRIIFPLHIGDADLPATVVGHSGNMLRLQFDDLTIFEEELLTMVLYSRADTWLGWGESREADQPMRSFFRIVQLSGLGLREAFNTVTFRKPKKARSRNLAVERVAPLLLAMALLGGAASTARAANIPTPSATATQTAGAFTSQFTLKDIGLSQPLEMRGIDSRRDLSFSLPQNQIVRQASLHVIYHFSPGLIAHLSHIKVMLNGTLFATLQAPEPGPDHDAILNATLTLPAELLVRNNQLSFEFIGHYVMTCEDPANTALWSRVDNNSTISMSGDMLPLADDLKVLPLPFFDSALTTPPVVPIVFSAQPSAKALEAAGIVTSYFGMLGDYRAMRFPVSIGSIPRGNAILIAENSGTLPAGANLPSVNGPTLAIRANPSDPYGKLLIVTGGDQDQLLTAARALAMGWNGLQGATVTINSFLPPQLREADDAPRWARTDRNVPLWNYANVDSLQGDGSGPLNTYLRLPPDLYFADKSNVALSLDYRYNSIPIGPASSLQLRANDAYIASLPLVPAQQASKVNRIRVAVPAVDLRPFSNSLSFNFIFQLLKKPGCVDTTPINMQGSILRDSYLDLRGLPHWAALPDLELFSNSGFPFTRFADLSQTTIVLPDDASPQEIELYLTLLGHFGAQTGFPALRVTVANADAMQQGVDRDFLVIGANQDQPAFNKLSASMPALISSDGLKVQDTAGFFAQFRNAWWKMKPTEQSVSGVLETTGVADTVIEGMESPYSRGRSIVVIAVKDAAAFDPMMSAFLKNAQSSDISGTVSVLHGSDFQSFRIGDSVYHVGNLPWWNAINLWFTEVPWSMAFGIVFFSFIFAVWTRTWLRRRARLRLQIMEG